MTMINHCEERSDDLSDWRSQTGAISVFHVIPAGNAGIWISGMIRIWMPAWNMQARQYAVIVRNEVTRQSPSLQKSRYQGGSELDSHGSGHFRGCQKHAGTTSSMLHALCPILFHDNHAPVFRRHILPGQNID